MPTRQRVTLVSTTYSPVELVQGLGRVPRLTSLSDSEQLVLCYRGTVEEGVAAVVSVKLTCLKPVVQQREDWEDIIIGAASRVSSSTSGMVFNKMAAPPPKPVLIESDDLIDGGKSSDDEDDDSDSDSDSDNFIYP